MIRVRKGKALSGERARITPAKTAKKTKAFSTRIEEDLLSQASDAALLKGISLRRFIEEALRDSLNKMLEEIGGKLEDTGHGFRLKVRARPGRPLRASDELRRLLIPKLVESEAPGMNGFLGFHANEVYGEPKNDEEVEAEGYV
ncbi:MAG: hypothetical protein PHI18_08900 [bacterium]|nr:hypothetical protein [bacterium]